MAWQQAPAKINLALHVTGRRADGYHQLDSIVVFASRGAADRVRVEPAEDFSLALSGPFAAGLEADESNLVLRAARALRARWPRLFPPVAIHLEKNLPLASGIGGGSADAAAVLNAMLEMAASPPPAEQVRKLALDLGADVPVCLSGRACRMRGIGEIVEPLALPAPLPALLVNPGVAVSTAEVFTALGLPPGSAAFSPLPEHLPEGGMEALIGTLRNARNDLQPPATAIQPAIARCLAELEKLPGVLMARMSGSGATCFALMKDRAAAAMAARALSAARPNWWIADCELGDG